MPFALLSLCLTLLGCQAPADGAPAEPARILFLGNSFTYVNDLPAMVAAVAEQAGVPRPVTGMVALPNASLEDLMAEGSARERLRASRWDFVVLQQGPSTQPDSRVHLIEWTRQWAPLIRQTGAEPVLYMVWPGVERVAATEDARVNYRDAARAVAGRFAPVGAGWRLALTAAPSPGVASGDGFHPSVAGTYLAAVVLVAVMTGADPAMLPAAVPGHPEIGAAAARQLQQVARQVLAAER